MINPKINHPIEQPCGPYLVPSARKKKRYAVCARDVPGLQGFWMNLLLYIHIYYAHIYIYTYIASYYAIIYIYCVVHIYTVYIYISIYCVYVYTVYIYIYIHISYNCIVWLLYREGHTLRTHVVNVVNIRCVLTRFRSCSKCRLRTCSQCTLTDRLLISYWDFVFILCMSVSIYPLVN